MHGRSRMTTDPRTPTMPGRDGGDKNVVRRRKLSRHVLKTPVQHRTPVVRKNYLELESNQSRLYAYIRCSTTRAQLLLNGKWPKEGIPWYLVYLGQNQVHTKTEVKNARHERCFLVHKKSILPGTLSVWPLKYIFSFISSVDPHETFTEATILTVFLQVTNTATSPPA